MPLDKEHYKVCCYNSTHTENTLITIFKQESIKNSMYCSKNKFKDAYGSSSLEAKIYEIISIL